MKIKVRNMVCRNCVSSLRALLADLGLAVTDVGLGYADVATSELTPEQWQAVDSGLQRLGFERIVDPAEAAVEQAKLEILRHVNSDEPCHMNLSHCIGDATGMDYKTVSRLFSAREGRTIEKFYVAAKIEKAKELLSYGDVPMAEIAYRLGYSSLAFLSRQFKQETGMTPTEYRRSRCDRRALNEI